MRVTTKEQVDLMIEFVLAIQDLETKARNLKLHITASALNNAKNAYGWEAAGDYERARMAAQGERPK